MGAKSLRIRSLDGLRGLAALIVLLHHSLLVLPAMAIPYFSSNNSAPGPVQILAFTPLHIFWMGTETVFVFFVLSGLVLALPVVRASKFDWLNYFPRRFVRLYLPVFGAIALAAVLLWFIPRSPAIPGLGEWVSDRAREYDFGAVAHDMTLVFGSSGVVSPLWSLRWEVIFSLALPLYILFVRRWRKLLVVKIALIVVVLTVAPILDIAPLIFLPIFAVGVLLAEYWTEFEVLGDRVNSNRQASKIWVAVALTAVLALTSYWTARGLGASELFARATWPAVVFGAVLLVFLASSNKGVKAWLETPVMAWSGRISFSLYLVHEPILLSTRFATASLPPWVAIIVGIPVALVVAAVFYRFVERPAHRLAKSLHARAIIGRFRHTRSTAGDQEQVLSEK